MVNGSLTNDGAGTTLGYDDENRLITIVKGTKRSEFVYDGKPQGSGRAYVQKRCKIPMRRSVTARAERQSTSRATAPDG